MSLYVLASPYKTDAGAVSDHVHLCLLFSRRPLLHHISIAFIVNDRVLGLTYSGKAKSISHVFVTVARCCLSVV